MAITKAARKGGMVAHIMRDESVSLCGRVMVVIPGGEGKRLCKSCARISGMVVTTEEFIFTDAEWEFIRMPRDAFSMFMVRDVLDDYAKTGDNDPRRIAIYNAIVEHHTMAATVIVTNAPGGNRGGGDGMVNPNSTATAKPRGILTENQRNALIKMDKFMDSLIVERMTLEGKEIPADWDVNSGLSEEWFSKLKTRADINKAFDSYSRGIDALKSKIAELKSNAAKARREESKSNPAEDGYYVQGDTFVCVKWNRAGTGQYATVWNGETWEYDRNKSYRLVQDVKAGKLTPMRPEDAKRFGDLYGTCFKCSRTLTDPESIAQGYGPICAGKMGW